MWGKVDIWRIDNGTMVYANAIHFDHHADGHADNHVDNNLGIR